MGLKLDLANGLSWRMIVLFIAGSCAIKIISVSLAARFAGFRGLDLANLAITTNARGGPGIVLASVAFDAGTIGPKFYTTLVLAAVLTSQMAGCLARLCAAERLAAANATDFGRFCDRGADWGDAVCGVIRERCKESGSGSDRTGCGNLRGNRAYR